MVVRRCRLLLGAAIPVGPMHERPAQVEDHRARRRHVRNCTKRRPQREGSMLAAVFDLSWLFWLFIVAQFFIPLYQKQMLALRRNRAFHGFEQRRKTRLITMIHRQETMSFLGFPIARYIDIEDSEQALRQVTATVKRLLLEHYSEADAERIANKLSSGEWTHDYALDVAGLREIGIKVTEDMPREVYELMDLFPQTSQRRPSVEFIPLPYTSPPPAVRPRGDSSS